jgi:hypothetical protein
VGSRAESFEALTLELGHSPSADPENGLKSRRRAGRRPTLPDSLATPQISETLQRDCGESFYVPRPDAEFGSGSSQRDKNGRGSSAFNKRGPGWGRLGSRAISDFNDVAVRVDEISVSNTGRVFAAAQQFSAGSFDLLHAIIQPALVGECEAEMRHTAASNRLTLVDSQSVIMSWRPGELRNTIRWPSQNLTARPNASW